MEILAEENVAATTAGVSQKLAGGSASTRKPRRALGDITNGGKSKLKLPQKTPGKTPGKGARGPKTPGAKAGSDPAMQVLQDGLKSLSIAPDAPDIEHAHLDDGAGIDWLKEDLGLDVDAMLGSVSACGGAIKSRGVPVGNAAPQAEACALSAPRSRAAAPPSRDRPLPPRSRRFCRACADQIIAEDQIARSDLLAPAQEEEEDVDSFLLDVDSVTFD